MTQDSFDDRSRMTANAAGPVPVVYPGQAALGSASPSGSADTCRGCGVPFGSSAAFCPRCGTPRAGAPTCPHCGSVADVAPEPEVRLACKTCGAPRVVVDLPGFQSSGAEIGPLRQAEAARRSRRWWRIGGAFGGLASGGVLLLSLLIQLIFGLSLVGTVATLVVALPFLLLAVASIARSSARSAEVKQAIEQAWLAAAKDVATHSKQTVSAATLTKALRLSEAQSENLLAELAVDDMVSSQVTEEGGLAFASTAAFEQPLQAAPEPQAAVPMRVATESAGSPAAGPRIAETPPATGLDAELEQMAAAEMAAREGKAAQQQGK